MSGARCEASGRVRIEKFDSITGSSSPLSTVRTQFIARVSGLPVQAISVVESPILLTRLERLTQVEADLETSYAKLSDAMHLAIGRIAAKADRNRLLELRRDLKLGKTPSARRLEMAQALLPTEVGVEIANHCALLRQRDELESLLRSTHTVECTRCRAAFQEAITDADFQKGVLTSSGTLFRNIVRYRSANPQAFGSREEQIERGLLRYYTRTVMKATPFATLCSVMPGEFVSASDCRARLRGNVKDKKGFVRLNKTLLQILWAHLLTRRAVRGALPIELNPTLELQGGHWRFLASFEGREVFQRMTRHDAIDAVIRIVQGRPDGSFDDLIVHLVSDPDLETTAIEAERYVDSLITSGLCRLRPAVPEQEPDWDRPLSDFLRAVDDEHARVVAQLVVALRVLLDSYARQDVGDRIRTLDLIRNALAEAFERLQLKMAIPRELPLFEDASLDAVFQLSDSADLRTTLDLVATVGRAMARLAAGRAEHITMRRYFDSKYHVGDRVPLLSFYEDFYREHFKEHLEKTRLLALGTSDEELRKYNQLNPLGAEAVLEMQRASGRASGVLKDAWELTPGAVEINVPLESIHGAIEAAPPISRAFSSISTFCQLLFDEEAACWRCVLSQQTFQAGFGKFFSRFLYALPASVLESVRATNGALTDDILAEIAGDSQFNANLHPPMMQWEISHPSGEGATGGSRVLASELEVTADPEDVNQLRLLRRFDGRRVYPIDLGFLNPLHRSPLYQLLGRFAPGSGTLVPVPERLASREDTGSPDRSSGMANAHSSPMELLRSRRIEYRPRLVIGDRLVVARRRWLVPDVAFPHSETSESAADYFLRVHRWRVALGLPQRVYVRVKPKPATASTMVAAPLQPREAELEYPSEGEDGQASAERVAEPAAEPDAVFAPQPEDGTMVPDGETGPASAVPRSTAVAARKSPTAAPATRRSRDYLKPQFIDFASPMLVALFGRVAAGLRMYEVRIEECYPTIEQLPLGSRQHFTAELNLQFDVKAEIVTASPAPSTVEDDDARF